jgi:diguanylate cyclase (GGDEF)-like protein/putative nucleotidyltransferase with HDIG domain
MFLRKTWRGIHPSYTQQVMRIVNKNPIAWGMILLMNVIFLLPFLLLDQPGMILDQLAQFFGGCVLSIAVAAWFRARAGGIVSWLVVMSSLCLISLHAAGSAQRMIQADGKTLFSVGIGFLVTGLAVGQLRSVSKRLMVAHRETTIAHERLAKAHATIQQQALTDALTGLPNHRAVMDQFSKELDRARRYNRQLSVLFFDADRFKKVNDTYGHAAGDAVLRQIGERAGSILRGDDTIGRFGGEEFVILLSETDAREASVVAERIRVAVADGPIATSEVEGGIFMTVSIGLSTFLIDGASEQELLAQADKAMYVAKQLGRNQVRTAEEARQIGADGELMTLLQQEGLLELAQRDGITPEQVREKYTKKMIALLLSFLQRRDESLRVHAYAVSELATTLAQTMGLEFEEVSRIGMAALLYDIGKVVVPDTLLQELSSLDHAMLGAQILEDSPFLSHLVSAVRHQHEWWNGSGYPDQLAGEDIPQAARIIAVVEAYNDVVRDHLSQASSASEETMAALQRSAGTQFDPAIVRILQEVLFSRQELQAVR